MIPRMSWLLFLDESGHDHKNCPYEVRGGVAIHAGALWPLVQELQAAELSAFGANMREYRTEIKGSKLLDKDRFKWAEQGDRMPDEARRKHARGLPVLDAVNKGADQRFVCQMERYFTRTQTGRRRTSWIVPVPMFVSSDMTMARPVGRRAYFTHSETTSLSP
jgi:hypothetical protein